MSEKSLNNISNHGSELFYDFYDTTQKEINNNEKTFTGTKVYDKSNEIDYSGK